MKKPKKINGICPKCERIVCECIKNCACNKQIVWFFGTRASVLVCKNCEITFNYLEKSCPYCNEEITEFKEVEQ